MVLKVIGTVTDGFGESSEWMPKYLPHLFPGTLNVELTINVPSIVWEEEVATEWQKPAKVAKCLINDVEAFVIMPPLASPKKRPKLIEIGSTVKLRESLSLSNLDVVTLTLNIN